MYRRWRFGADVFGTREDDGIDGDWDGPAIMECFAKPRKIARKANVVVATYRLQAGVSIDTHFQVAFAFIYTFVGDFSAANQAVNRLRAWKDLKRTTFLYIQSGRGGKSASLGHLEETCGISLRSGAPRVRESQAFVLYREHQHRVQNKPNWTAFFRDVDVVATEHDDGPWASLPPDSPASPETWWQLHAEYGPHLVKGKDPKACREAVARCSEVLRMSMSRHLLSGAASTGEPVSSVDGFSKGSLKTLRGSLREPDSGDITTSKLMTSYRSRYALNPAIEQALLFKLGLRLCFLSTGGVLQKSMRAVQAFLPFLLYTRYTQGEGSDPE